MQTINYINEQAVKNTIVSKGKQYDKKQADILIAENVRDNTF